jgi:trk system potassium uptake protein TrkA
MFASKEPSGIIVAGCGRFGSFLAEQLNIADENVSIIDVNSEAFNRCSPDFTGLMVEGDASNIEILRQAGISSVRTVISATDNDNINLMIAQIARAIYEVPIVIAVVHDSKILSAKEEYDFELMCPAIVMTQEILNKLKLKVG